MENENATVDSAEKKIDQIDYSEFGKHVVAHMFIVILVSLIVMFVVLHFKGMRPAIWFRQMGTNMKICREYRLEEYNGKNFTGNVSESGKSIGSTFTYLGPNLGYSFTGNFKNAGNFFTVLFKEGMPWQRYHNTEKE